MTITFATQEDFEEAVMAVLRERLKVGVTVSSLEPTKVKVSLFDAVSGNDIDSSTDKS